MREAMLIVHFIGLSMGLGTSFGMMFLGIKASKMPPDEGRKFMMNASALSMMGHIGLGLLILSGGYLATPYWSSFGTDMLFTVKLCLVVVLAALIGIMTSMTKKVKKGGPPETMNTVRMLSILALLVALTIVTLAVLRFQ